MAGIGLGMWRRGRDGRASGPQPATIQLSGNTIAESATAGSAVGTLTVANGTGTWTFTEIAPLAASLAVAAGGAVTTVGALDFETAPALMLNVSATNGTDTITRSFSITVTNVLEGATLGPLSIDDAAHVEDGPATSAILGAASGSTLAIAAGALPDGMTLNSAARTITGTPATPGTFAFTLAETLADSPNSGRQSALSITIAAAGDTTAPTITSASPTGSYAEGVAIGGTLTASEAVTWSKSGTDAALVTLNTATGAWSLPATDFEAKASYSWTFTATDGAGNATNQAVAITITDVDEVPAAFTFADVTGATASTLYESNTITVAGMASGAVAAVAVIGGEFAKNGGAWTSTAGTASNGDTFKLRHTSSASGSTATDTTLTIGGISDTYTTTTAAGAPSYSADATAYFAALTVQPDDTRKTLIDNLILGLQADGVWSLLDRLIIAGHDEQATRRDLRAPSKIASAVNSPPFTIDRGFSGDRVSAYLDLGEVFGGGGQYTINGAHVGAWVVTQSGSNTAAPFGSLGNASQNRVHYTVPASGNEVFQINDAGTTDVLRTSTGSRLGHRQLVRAGAAVKRAYFNGVLAADLATASTSLPGSNMTILRRATSYSGDRVAIFHCGAALTTTQAAALHSRFSTYLTAIGAI